MKIGVIQLTSIHAHVSYCIHTFFSSKLAQKKKKLVEKSKRKRQKEIRLQYYCIKIRLKEDDDDDDDKKYLETAAITDAFLCWQTEREREKGRQWCPVSMCNSHSTQQPRHVLE